MDVTFVTTYPTTGYQRRSESHKPSIRVIIGRTCFSTHIGGNSITTNTSTCSFINNGAQHNQHFICTWNTYHLLHLRCKGRKHITVTIFNACNKQWSHTNSFIGKSCICTYHLTDRNFTRSQTKRNHWVNCFITNPKTMDQTYKIIRIQFAHQISRNPVIRISQSPLQSHHFPITFIICITRRPRSSVLINQRLLYVACLITRRKAIFHC